MRPQPKISLKKLLTLLLCIVIIPEIKSETQTPKTQTDQIQKSDGNLKPQTSQTLSQIPTYPAFSINSFVLDRHRNKIKITDLTEDDQLLTLSPLAHNIFQTKFIDYLRTTPTRLTLFTRLTLDSNETLEISPDQ
jgi:hypothetical protein